ncbi:MAG: MarR family transcriptional regulator [Gammaproteobacteria bacterium]|nr:MarR family transcriptional regulator [Gammaproteobacteria bacterium]
MTNQTTSCLNIQMLRASHWVLKTYEDAYRPHGIRATQVPVLQLIAKHGPVSVKQIAEQSITERSVLSRKLSVMESNGWVAKINVKGTQERLYQVTDLGQQKLAAIEHVRCQTQQRLLDTLTAQEQTLLLGLCEKLTLANS